MIELEISEAKTATFVFEVVIESEASRVWTALTEEINEWWLPDFHMLGGESRVTLDARAGGLLQEVLEGGGSLAWFTVQMSVPGKSLDLVGDLSADFGGPATTLMKIGLDESEGTTTLRVKNSTIGRISEDGQQGTAECWIQIFRDGLKAFVERPASEA